MLLTTPIRVPATPCITHASRIMMIGSCFASCLAERLARLCFDVMVNPFGITYNPISIAGQMERMRDRRPYGGEELMRHEGLFFSPDHHGSFSTATAEGTLANINREFSQAVEFLPSATHVVLTLGSSVVYEHEGRVWNNCHKVPQREFTKRRLTVEEVVEALHPVIRQMAECRFILTVSPVRYLDDNNSMNKATLLLAVERLCAMCGNALYFPAYEIMMDELRDYRFYADDMTHPSQMAEGIIFERFAETYFTRNTRALNGEIAKVEAMRNHRPLHPETEAYDRFKTKLTRYEKNVADAVASSRSGDDDSPVRQ